MSEAKLSRSVGKRHSNAVLAGLRGSPGVQARKRIAAAAPAMLAALLHVRAIIKDGAMTGFNCHDGDWANRLFASQAVTHAAVTKATKPPPPVSAMERP